jgi:hypothetical protein
MSPLPVIFGFLRCPCHIKGKQPLNSAQHILLSSIARSRVYAGIIGGKGNILGGHNVGHSKQNSLYTRICVLFRTVSEIQRFHCTVCKLLIRKRYYVLFLMPLFIVQVTKVDTVSLTHGAAPFLRSRQLCSYSRT